jgi:hypothetical protein
MEKGVEFQAQGLTQEGDNQSEGGAVEYLTLFN